MFHILVEVCANTERFGLLDIDLNHVSYVLLQTKDRDTFVWLIGKV